MANASRPRRAASSANSSGCDAPSRNEKFEWECSSAYGTDPVRRCTAGTNGWRLRDHAGLSPPLAHGGRFVGRPSLRRRSSSFQGMAGLLKPTLRDYRTGVRPARGTAVEQDERVDWHRVRSSYDTVARAYEERFLEELSHKPRDRELLERFAAAVGDPVVDVGCGPGQIGAFL